MPEQSTRILLVDNERAWLDFSSKILEEAGYSVATASSPAEISKLLAETVSKFDLILVDLKYAEEDGWLLGQLARLGFTGRCIVVLFPIQMTPLEMVEMFRTGVVQDCVDKQYISERLVFWVQRTISKV